MDILNFILDHWTVIGSTTVLSTLLSIFTQHRLNKDSLVFKSALDGDLEELKSSLLAENNRKISELNIQLETVKSELALQNSRVQIAYSGILEDQISVLKELYRLILNFELALHERNENLSDYEIVNKPGKILDEFKQLYFKNAIFIPKKLDDKIKTIFGFGFVEINSNRSLSAVKAAKNGDLEEANKLSQQERNQMDKLYEIRDEFRDEIRLILGLMS